MLELMSVSATPSREWEESGQCRVMGLHPDVFDDVGPNVKQAKRTCARCPVKQKCLDVNIDEPWGIWGGLNTIERKAHAGGAPIELCDGCGQTFARVKGEKCTACQRTPVTPSVLRAHTDLVRTLADMGLTDPEIAAKISAVAGVLVKPSHVRATRRRHHIDAGIIHASRARTSVSEAALSVARTRGMPGWLELSTIEKRELFRRWLADGGTTSTFCLRYKLSWARAHEFRESFESEAS